MIMNFGAQGAKFFLSIKNGQIFFTEYMANDDFFEPPRCTDSKNPISFFAEFWVWVTSEARGQSR